MVFALSAFNNHKQHACGWIGCADRCCLLVMRQLVQRRKLRLFVLLLAV